MNDTRVRAAIEQMEAWLADASWEPNADTLAQWDTEFQAALAEAEKASGWPELRDRAHAAGHQLEARRVVLAAALDQVRRELEVQERGVRALKGYGASTR
ncbi:MAG: hypothetical protein HGB30_02980 [Holophagaceae bacterium]|nr:hypothetical protein [Holophagaceae bacterium]